MSKTTTADPAATGGTAATTLAKSMSTQLCILCDIGGGAGVLRLRLRNCGHVICVPCALGLISDYLEEEDEEALRIHCPGDCARHIHPNDVESLLKQNEKVDKYMPADERRELHELYERTSVLAALGGEERTRQCPNCCAIYARRPGCNFVRCVDRHCRQTFCWPCGAATDGLEHFAKSKKRGGLGCRVSWDDVWRSLWPLRMLFETDENLMFCLMPCVYSILAFMLPVYVCYGFVAFCKNKVVRRLRRRKLSETVCKIALAIVLASLPALCMAYYTWMWTAMATALLMTFYSPCFRQVSRIDNVLSLIQCVLQTIGFDMWIKIFRDHKEAQEMREVMAEYSESTLRQARTILAEQDEDDDDDDDDDDEEDDDDDEEEEDADDDDDEEEDDDDEEEEDDDDDDENGDEEEAGHEDDEDR